MHLIRVIDRIKINENTTDLFFMPRLKRPILFFNLFPSGKISIINIGWHILPAVIYPAHKPGGDGFSLNFVVSGCILQF
jgi:hypothetical protein